MEPYNPYSPPESRESAPPRRLASNRARGTWIKWTYLFVAAISFVVAVGTQAMSNLLGPDAVTAAAWLFFVAWLTLTAHWIHTAWSETPPTMRGAVRPNDAVWKLFIPIFNLYWGFFISGRLCEILDRRLARLRLEPMAPKGLGVLGCCLQIAVYLALVPGFVGIGPFIAAISHGVWFNYMLECDKARVILAEQAIEE